MLQLLLKTSPKAAVSSEKYQTFFQRVFNF